VRAEGGPTFVADAGNLLWKSPTIPSGERAQAVVKADLIAEAVKLGGIDAVAPGAGDLALGLGTLRAYDLPWVAANLTCSGDAPFPASRAVTRAGTDGKELRVRFVGVVGPTARVEGCVVGDPAEALRSVVAAAGGEVVVVLSNQSGAEDRALAAAVPGMDLVVNGQDRRQLGAPDALPGGALGFAFGSRAKHLGRVDLRLAEGATDVTPWRDDAALARLRDNRDRTSLRLSELRRRAETTADPAARARIDGQITLQTAEMARADAAVAVAEGQGTAATRAQVQLLELSSDLPDHPATAALVAAAKARLATVDAPSAGAGASFQLGTSPWVGSAACEGCHAAATAQWATTPHARAWASLVTAGRASDRECWSCHATGANLPGGPSDPSQVHGLENVGCESCHGPGRAHAASPATVHLTETPDIATCTRCHDGVRDEGRFDAGAYLVRVQHGAAAAPPR
jgi:hypothetical protein